MPPEAAEYAILLALKTTLRGIAVAAGYHYDVASDAVKLDMNTDIAKLIGASALRPFIAIEVLPETREYASAMRTTLTTPVLIHWVHDAVQIDDETRMQTFFRGCADIEKAIAPQATACGGLASIKIIDRVLSREALGAQVWAVVRTEIMNKRVFGAA